MWTVAVALVAAAPMALAGDRAVPRDGGGGGSRDRGSSGGGHTSSGSTSSSGSSYSGSSGSDYQKTGRTVGGSRSSGSSHGRAVPRTDAERRHPRPGTGTGDAWYGGGRRYGGYYGNRYRYGSWGYWDYGYYDPYYWRWGYSPYYYGGYYGYSPSYYRRYRGYRDSGAVRVMVDPERTRVYVDGYYAGVADDFDGLFQRLYLPPGRHDITLRLEGYRTQHFKVYVPVDGTIKLHYDMVRGEGESTSEQYAGEPFDYARIEERDADDDRDDDRPYRREARGNDDGLVRAEAAMVRFDVRPSDASIYVDGEFKGAARRLSSLRLPTGAHRIEVVRPGYRTEEREIDVRPGGDVDVRIDLVRN
jgi:hypothetical protein